MTALDSAAITMDKKALTESDIRTKFITPALRAAGWDEMAQIREEVSFTKGRIIVRGKLVSRGKGKRADYILYYKPNLPIALIEAKDNNHAVGDGMQQALDYAETLNIPFVFTSNGDGFVFHDRTGASAELETTLLLDAFPPPGDLWARYRVWKGLAPESPEEEIVLQDYFDDASARTPRYYQVNAINAATEAIAKGRNRVLLVMATGTGQDLHGVSDHLAALEGRPQEADPVSGRPQRVDRPDHGQRLSTVRRGDGQVVNERRHHRARRRGFKSATGAPANSTGATGNNGASTPPTKSISASTRPITGPEDHQKIFREFSPGFFDLIVIDECHRGSAAEDSAWREILEYFSSATADRPDRHAQGNALTSRHRLLRRARLLLFPEARHPGWLPGPLQGHQGPHRSRRGGLPSRAGAA